MFRRRNDKLVLGGTMFFDSVAYAMAPPAGGSGGGAGGLLAGPLPMLVLMFAIFYFLLIRPQQKKQKALKQMLENLKVGDKVWTNGGLRGEIIKIDGDVLTVQIAEGVTVDIRRGYVTELDGPVAEAGKKEDKK